MPFDYLTINEDVRPVVAECASSIRSLLQRAAQDIVDIGLKLIEVKEKLPHGAFLPWLGAEFDWSIRTAQRFIAVAESFGDKCDTVSHFESKALYLLAASSTPEQARQEAASRADDGESITHAKAKEIVARHKQHCVPSTITASPSIGNRTPGCGIQSRLTYASLCSGIEGASVAFEEFGWMPVAFSEIDEYCCGLLQAHYPDVPNLGDIRQITGEQLLEAEQKRLAKECSSSSPERPANRSQSTVSDWVWLMSVANLPSSFCESFASARPGGSSGKTSPVPCQSTEDGLLAPCSGGWLNAGMGGPTESLTLATSESPSDAVASSLWDIVKAIGGLVSLPSLTDQQRSNMANRLLQYKGTIPEPIAPLFGDGAETLRPSSEET